MITLGDVLSLCTVMLFAPLIWSYRRREDRPGSELESGVWSIRIGATACLIRTIGFEGGGWGTRLLGLEDSYRVGAVLLAVEGMVCLALILIARADGRLNGFGMIENLRPNLRGSWGLVLLVVGTWIVCLYASGLIQIGGSQSARVLVSDIRTATYPLIVAEDISRCVMLGALLRKCRGLVAGGWVLCYEVSAHYLIGSGREVTIVLLAGLVGIYLVTRRILPVVICHYVANGFVIVQSLLGIRLERGELLVGIAVGTVIVGIGVAGESVRCGQLRSGFEKRR